MRTIIFSVLAATIIAVSTIFFVFSFGKPNIDVSLTLKNQIWKVSTVSPIGLAYRSGIKEGDIPVEINNQPAQIFLERYQKAGQIDQMLIKEAVFSDASGNLTRVSLQDVSYFGPTLIVQIPSFIVCLIFWAIGLYVFFRGRKSSPALLWGLVCLFVGLMLCANMAAILAISCASQLAIVIAMMGPCLLFHFLLILPDERARLRNNPLLHLVYLPGIITTALFFLIGWDQGQPTPGFRNVRFGEIGLVLLAIAALAIYNYVRAASPRTRQQMKIVLSGCLAALLPFLIFYLLPQTLNGRSIIPTGFSILSLVFIPAAMGYAVITQKFMDIDVIIRRGLIYGLITLIMATILSAATIPVLLLDYSFTSPEVIVITLVLGAVASALFGPIKKLIETLVDKLFYKDRYDYRTIIQGLSSTLNNEKDLPEISRLVVGTLYRTLNLAGACLFLKLQPNSYYASAAQGIFIESDRQNRILAIILRRNPQMEFPNSTSGEDPSISFIIPLIAGEREIAILVISQKTSRQVFSSDDVYLLQGVASVAAVILRSALLAHDVSARDSFVSIASHELRSPLTSLMGYSSLLLKRERSEEQRRQWLKNIELCGKQLSDIVDNLLNVSRIQNGRMDLKLEEVNLAEILEECFLLINESDEKHEFIINLEPSMPSPRVDRTKFGQIINNLLSNAVKYSPNGGCITLAARYDPPNHRIEVSVSDQGIGIGPEDKSSLFRTFHRIDRPETRSVKGVGLGLYIVKEWTEAMGGQVWLESELNKGATFFVAIPVNGKCG